MVKAIKRILRDHDESLISYRRDKDVYRCVKCSNEALKSLKDILKRNPEHINEVIGARSTVYLRLSMYYLIYGSHDLAVSAAARAIKTLRKTTFTDSDMYYCQLQLYRALQGAGRNGEARSALLRTITCYLSFWESKWLNTGLRELVEFEHKLGNSEVANAYRVLEEGLRRERDYVHRAKGQSTNDLWHGGFPKGIPRSKDPLESL